MSKREPSLLERLADRILIYGIRSLILVILLLVIGGYMAVAGLVGRSLTVAIIGAVIFVMGALLGFGFAITSVTRRRPTSRSPALMVGVIGEARTNIPPMGRGVIYAESELWTAISESKEEIREGQKVVIVGWEGLSLRVKKHEEKPETNSRARQAFTPCRSTSRRPRRPRRRSPAMRQASRGQLASARCNWSPS